MTRFALTALTVALFAGGSTVAIAQQTTTTTTTTTTVTETVTSQAGGQPEGATAKEELSGTQPQAKVEGATTGDLTEPTMEKIGQESGAEGTTASLVTEDEKIEKESDVEGAKPEEMLEKGDTATIN